MTLLFPRESTEAGPSGDQVLVLDTRGLALLLPKVVHAWPQEMESWGPQACLVLGVSCGLSWVRVSRGRGGVPRLGGSASFLAPGSYLGSRSGGSCRGPPQTPPALPGPTGLFLALTRVFSPACAFSRWLTCW